jgi:hypothetical protein
MNLRLLTGYVLLVICAGVVALAAIITLMNTGYSWELHVLYRPVSMSRAAWLLLAAAGGIVIALDVGWLLPRTIRQLQSGLAEKKQKTQEKMLKAISAERQAQAASPEANPTIKL